MRLGGSVDREWARTGRDLARLPEIAASALRRFDARRIDPFELAERAMADRRLPTQLAVPFGDAQLTIWRNDHLLVQLVFWLDQTTAIHQHGFGGAFRLLQGASLHSTYMFTSRIENAGIRLGALVRTNQELLETGDVRKIGAGSALIHNLIHLVFPSVTLVVRTPTLPALTPQWVFHPPGVAVDPLPPVPDATLRARVRIHEACARLERRRGLRAAEAMIATGLAASWALLEAASAEHEDNRALAPYLRMVRRHHGHAGDALARAITLIRVRAQLFALRRRVRERQHRTFLALLADAGDRETILEAIERIHPERGATAQIERWLLALAEPLQLSLDRPAARLLRRVIEQRPLAEIAAELQGRGYPLALIAALAKAFQASPMFAALFTTRKLPHEKPR